MTDKKKDDGAIGEIEMTLISSRHLNGLTLPEKIRLIIDGVKDNKIVILEQGLSPTEESQLIESTMVEIDPNAFSGLEIESYAPDSSWFHRILRRRPRAQMTIIGPAKKLRAIKKDRDMLDAVVLATGEEQ